MAAGRIIVVTPDCRIDPIEVIGLRSTRSGATRILLYAGEVTVQLAIDEVDRILKAGQRRPSAPTAPRPAGSSTSAGRVTAARR